MSLELEMAGCTNDESQDRKNNMEEDDMQHDDKESNDKKDDDKKEDEVDGKPKETFREMFRQLFELLSEGRSQRVLARVPGTSIHALHCREPLCTLQ